MPMSDPRPLPKTYKSPLMLDVEAMYFGRDIRLVLIDLYNRLGSTKAVAKRLGLSAQTVRLWFRSLGIVVRQRQEAVLDPNFGQPPPTAPPP
jgi:hypothetical protein